MMTGDSQVSLCVSDSSSELSLSQLPAFSVSFSHNKLTLLPYLFLSRFL